MVISLRKLPLKTRTPVVFVACLLGLLLAEGLLEPAGRGLPDGMLWFLALSFTGLKLLGDAMRHD